MSLIDALAAAAAPTLAIVANRRLAARDNRRIEAKVRETHELVNGQRTELVAQLAAAESEADQLRAQLAQLPGHGRRERD